MQRRIKKWKIMLENGTLHAGESFNSTVQARQWAEKKPGDSELVHKPLRASTFSLVGFLVGIFMGRWTWEKPFVPKVELMVAGRAVWPTGESTGVGCRVLKCSAGAVVKHWEGEKEAVHSRQKQWRVYGQGLQGLRLGLTVGIFHSVIDILKTAITWPSYASVHKLTVSGCSFPQGRCSVVGLV